MANKENLDVPIDPHGLALGSRGSKRGTRPARKTSSTNTDLKKVRKTDVVYEEDDLRKIFDEALVKSIEPYEALLKSGVIKNASEFFASSDI
jgi:hypothetical protein